MSEEEMIILNFLKQNAETAFARRDIAKRAVKRRVYEADPHWADQPLQTLVGPVIPPLAGLTGQSFKVMPETATVMEGKSATFTGYAFRAQKI